MSVSDPVSDMLIRIRNATMAGLEHVEMAHSILKNEIARILKKEGFISYYVTEGHGGKKNLRLYLKYTSDRKPVIQGLRRVSKPGLRQYKPAREVPRVLGGMGIAILSTSKGLLTDREAKKTHVGGEVLCYVW
jgi:small subunit ribosomal protein S8